MILHLHISIANVQIDGQQLAAFAAVGYQTPWRILIHDGGTVADAPRI